VNPVLKSRIIYKFNFSGQPHLFCFKQIVRMVVKTNFDLRPLDFCVAVYTYS
jgi:hypothetical protein